MLTSILDEQSQSHLKEVRGWTTDLLALLARQGAPLESQQNLRHSLDQLDELFLLVIVGEFNAGKSAFINSLLDFEALPEGVTPTTAKVHTIRYGEEAELKEIDGEHVAVTAPVPLLKELHLVDTPGTNAIVKGHQEVTEHFVPRSDLVLFITSADRPFSESERQFIERIRAWGKKVVFIVNKFDLLQDEKSRATVLSFVSENASKLMGYSVEPMAVSARLAKLGRQGDQGAWESSGFEQIEQFIGQTLGETGRVALKLSNPLGVGIRLATDLLQTQRDCQALLAEDVSTLEQLERQIQLYKTDMHRDFDLRLADIGNVLYEMENRGDAFFEETLRIGRVLDLVNKSKVQQTFEHQVIADTPQEIERRVSELIDWFVSSDLKQWQAVTEHVEQRKGSHKERMVGAVHTKFENNRTTLLESVGRTSRDVVSSYETSREAAKIANSAQEAVAASAVAEVGAIGLGALVTLLATTVAADVTGLLAASMVAVMGFFVIPAKRRKAKAEMNERIAQLRELLLESIGKQLHRELDNSIARLMDGIAPYTRFVQSERGRLGDCLQELEALIEREGELKGRIHNP